MEKEQIQRLMGVVRSASDLFGGIYSRIWERLRNDANAESVTAFLSVYGNCQDAMDFAVAYEIPETYIYTEYRLPSNTRKR